MQNQKTTNVIINLLSTTLKWFLVAVVFLYFIALVVENFDLILHTIVQAMTFSMDYYYLLILTQGVLFFGFIFCIIMVFKHGTIVEKWPVKRVMLSITCLYVLNLTSFFVSYSWADISEFQAVFYVAVFVPILITVVAFMGLLKS
ncbi:MAG: hypothetical protein KZQ70_09185 [gamma proteobacterium symbiont of Lucinoma myriamae]|nr:hypothetical protein [gamma proteobacterium symbiont of Lucinoma myriamae]MCU7818927.1 hypothetical protein [gamma proteobacterium symbiont of Lucinoma myriamae]